MILRRPSDSLVLGFSPGAKYRVAFTDVTETVHAISDMHQFSPASEYVFGGTMAATALMAADLRRAGESLGVRLDCDGAAAGSYTEYSTGGHLRGYMRRKVLEEYDADPPANHEQLVGSEFRALAYLSRPGAEPDGKSVFRVSPPTFRNLVETYYLESFQLPSWANVGVRMDSAGVAKAMGIMVQCMPDGAMQEFVERVDVFTSEETLARVMDDPALETARAALDLPDIEIGTAVPLEFRCGCSRERSRAMLAGMPIRDLEEMAAAGAPQVVSCHFCGSAYEFPPEELREILAARKKA